jgi:O-acetyl-ADP-ribose deacetylase (regulator of RNase III)
VSGESKACSTASPATSTGMIGTPLSTSTDLMSEMIRVSAKPGQKALTRIPCGCRAGPSARTSPTTACLFAP